VPSRFSDERALEISGVVVRAGHRGRGVGRALVREAARFASTHAVRWVTLKTFAPNEESMAFWEGLGFTPGSSSSRRPPRRSRTGWMPGRRPPQPMHVLAGPRRGMNRTPYGFELIARGRTTDAVPVIRRGWKWRNKATEEPVFRSSPGPTSSIPGTGSARPRGVRLGCRSITSGNSAGSTNPSIATSQGGNARAARPRETPPWMLLRPGASGRGGRRSLIPATEVG
jgi:hypothetical protein